MRAWGAFAALLFSAVAAGDESWGTTYAGLGRDEPWVVELISQGEWSFKDRDSGHESYRSTVVLAPVPKLGNPGTMGLFLQRYEWESDSQRSGKMQIVEEPPKLKSKSNGIVELFDSKVDTKRGPKLAYGGYLTLDLRGRWIANERHGLRNVHEQMTTLALLWPELPGRPLEAGLRWRSVRNVRQGRVKDRPVELDMEVVAVDRAASPPIATLRVHADRSIPRDELDGEDNWVVALEEGGTERLTIDGTMHVRADAPEWLDGDATIALVMADSAVRTTSREHVTIKLTRKPADFCDCQAVAYRQLTP